MKLKDLGLNEEEMCLTEKEIEELMIKNIENESSVEDFFSDVFIQGYKKGVEYLNKNIDSCLDFLDRKNLENGMNEDNVKSMRDRNKKELENLLKDIKER